MRVTVEEKPDKMVLKLEGRLAGAWVTELDHLWAAISGSRNGRKLALDLRGTTYADRSGIQALRTIYRESGAELLTGSPWTQYLAEVVERNEARPNEEV